MLDNPYQFALLFCQSGRTAVACSAADLDWEPAVECARFHFVRKGELPAVNGGIAARIQPLWDQSAGEPYCRGFRVCISRNGSRPVTADYTARYFRHLASRASQRLVDQGNLDADEEFQYVVIALHKAEMAADSSTFEMAEKPAELPLLDASLEPWVEGAQKVGVVDPDDMPVFIPRRVLDEAAALTKAEQGRETGGVLIGVLRRDASALEVLAEVTAQIPAEHTRGDAVKLTFTAETWAAVDAAIRLRRRSEMYLGYWHSHPVREWCKSRDCTIEKQKSCKLAKDFFSVDDQALLRAAFPRAYSLGVVVNDTAFADMTFSLFGWREGQIQPRGFYLIEENYA